MPGGIAGAAGVGMAHSMSHHGTNTSVGTASGNPSANASPNLAQKRRRPSAVKTEAPDGVDGGPITGGGGGEGKVKQSPGGRKRMKGGN